MITIGWVRDEGAYIVRQDGEFIGDFEELEAAANFALDVAECSDTHVELIPRT